MSIPVQMSMGCYPVKFHLTSKESRHIMQIRTTPSNTIEIITIINAAKRSKAVILDGFPMDIVSSVHEAFVKCSDPFIRKSWVSKILPIEQGKRRITKISNKDSRFECKNGRGIFALPVLEHIVSSLFPFCIPHRPH